MLYAFAHSLLFGFITTDVNFINNKNTPAIDTELNQLNFETIISNSTSFGESIGIEYGYINHNRVPLTIAIIANAIVSPIILPTILKNSLIDIN